MKNKALLILSILFATCLFSSVAAAQTGGNYTITHSVIAGGGGNSSSGNTFSVTGTAGQAAAGTVSGGGNFSLAGGFWTAAPAGTIVISGNVTKNGSALQGATITLSGSASGSTTTDVSGYYEFTGLLISGTYTVTPSLANHVFSDTVSNNPSVTFTNVQEDQTADFIATQCSYSLNPTSINPGPGATTGSFTVATMAGCPWTATPSNSWLQVTSGSPGNGSGTVNYSVSANSGAARMGTITVGGQTFNVTQALGHSISGTVTYGTNLSKVVPGVTVTAVGPATTFAVTNLSGAYVLEGLTDGVNYTVTPTKTGDRNNITAFDATLVLRHVAASGSGPNALNANQQIAADANGSGDITAFDATMILRYVAANGPNDNTGQVGNWKFEPVSSPYHPLNSSVSGADYTAFMIGDVNGSWVPPASLADTEAAEGQQSETENFNLTPEQKEAGETAASVQISLPTNLSAAKGSTILIPVMLSNKTGREISGYAVEVTFDSAVLQIDADNPIETSGTLSESGGFSVAVYTETPGRVGIAAGGGKSAVNSAGTLVNLRFAVIGEANNSKKSSPLSVSRKSFEDQEGMRLAARSGNHQFTVKSETPTVAGVGVGGRVLGKDGQGIGNVLVRLVDRQGIEKIVVTSDFGYYRFADIQANQSYTISVSGKKYKFTQSSQVRLVLVETNELNFVADN